MIEEKNDCSSPSNDYCELCEQIHEDGRCYKTIFIQCCTVCEIVESAYVLEPDEYYPVFHEWLEECFIGTYARNHFNDPTVDISYGIYCSVECDIEHNGWPEGW